jgi:hypothetical protein
MLCIGGHKIVIPNLIRNLNNRISRFDLQVKIESA